LEQLRGQTARVQSYLLQAVRRAVSVQIQDIHGIEAGRAAGGSNSRRSCAKLAAEVEVAMANWRRQSAGVLAFARRPEEVANREQIGQRRFDLSQCQPAYAGSTSQRRLGQYTAEVNNPGAECNSGITDVVDSDGRDKSLGNVSRENKTSFELFLAPFSTWKQSDWQLAESCNS
jgi:hypothetical protein